MGEISDYTRIHKVDFNEQVVFNKNFKTSTLTFIQIHAKYSVSLDYKENINSIEFTDCKFDSSFDTSCFEKLEHYTQYVDIDFMGVLYGNYIFEELPTKSINLSGINFGNIIFNQPYSQYIWFRDFSNFGKVLLKSNIPDPKFNVFIIDNSNINNTEFENIDFRLFDELIIRKSEVSSMILTNSFFPEEFQIEAKDPLLGVLN